MIFCTLLIFDKINAYICSVVNQIKTMKKVIIAACVAVLAATATAQSGNSKSSLEFQKYIAKKISYNTSFAKQEVQGTIKVRVNVTPTGVEEVDIISGLNPLIDEEVVKIIKSTPSKVAGKVSSEGSVSMVLPVKLVIAE